MYTVFENYQKCLILQYCERSELVGVPMTLAHLLIYPLLWVILGANCIFTPFCWVSLGTNYNFTPICWVSLEAKNDPLLVGQLHIYPFLLGQSLCKLARFAHKIQRRDFFDQLLNTV